MYEHGRRIFLAALDEAGLHLTPPKLWRRFKDTHEDESDSPPEAPETIQDNLDFLQDVRGAKLWGHSYRSSP